MRRLGITCFARVLARVTERYGNGSRHFKDAAMTNDHRMSQGSNMCVCVPWCGRKGGQTGDAHLGAPSK